MADITRFHFHAMKFMYSEDVRAMSAEEIGQYVLLLCESWLGGKDATLPTDKNMLANMARSEKIFPKVMRKFDLIDTKWGQRYRNETLYNEWVNVEEKSEKARSAASQRWQYDRNASAFQPAMRNSTDAMLTEHNITEENITQHNKGDFKNLAARFRKAFGFRTGKGDKVLKDYNDACSKYGEELLLEKFEEWAAENQWVAEKKAKFPLSAFYRWLAESTEEDAITAQLTKKDLDKNPEIVVDLSAIAAETEKEHERIMAEDLARRTEEEAAKAIPFAF